MADTLNEDSWSGAQWVRTNGLGRGHTSVSADDLCTVVGSDVSARNPFVVIVRVVSMSIASVSSPNEVTEKNDFRFLAECISAVQSALMSWTSVDNWTMFKLQSRGCVLSFVCVDTDVVAHVRQS